VILGYYEDGPNLVSMAMNGWGAAEPAWWLNLQADPQALVERTALAAVARARREPRRLRRAAPARERRSWSSSRASSPS